jgi:hypothetical protein
MPAGASAQALGIDSSVDALRDIERIYNTLFFGCSLPGRASDTCRFKEGAEKTAPARMVRDEPQHRYEVSDGMKE